jgi:hypothetical protein
MCAYEASAEVDRRLLVAELYAESAAPTPKSRINPLDNEPV